MINVCVAGATGWTGTPIARAVLAADDLTLVSAVSRGGAGKDLGVAWGSEPVSVPVFGTVAEALDGVDVVIDFTSHAVVKANALTAVARRVSVVIGSSGLTGDDVTEIAEAAEAQGVAVIVAGNFSITAAMAQAASLLAARHLPHWEIVDYASAAKPDVPSGTARELAERLSAVRRPEIGVPVAEIAGPAEARGADVDGTQVHSVRLPSFVVSTEVVFGLPDERLMIRHDAGSGPEPYVTGALTAVRALPGRVGLTRGLDTLLLGG
jgi:4-hydroxy-tetrahydrodipicolinate reductase